ncbi:hypothetical protein VC95412_001146A, partial [Vibrio cholerae O1 str. 95412]
METRFGAGGGGGL